MDINKKWEEETVTTDPKTKHKNKVTESNVSPSETRSSAYLQNESKAKKS